MLIRIRVSRSPVWVLLLLLWAAFLPASVQAATQRLTLLHFNDFHGQIQPYTDPDSGRSVGGLARLATLVREIRAEDPSRAVILLFAGDMLQGTLTSSLFFGWPDTGLFNALGVDAAAMGNHELDYGQDSFRDLAARAHYPILAANVEVAGLPLGVRPYAFLEPSGGPRVAVLGLTTDDLVTATHPRNSVGISIQDPATVAQALVPALAERSDVLVVLSHLGLQGDRRIAAQVRGVDIIVGGHNHYAFAEPKSEHGVLIVQAGERGRLLGRMDLEVSDGRVRLVAYRLIPIDAAVAEDPVVAAQVADLAARAEVQVNEVVGRAAAVLDGRREVVRRVESNLGDFTADLARERTGAQVALFNGGGFRSSVRAGEVHIKDLYAVFPFGNQLVTGRMSGAQLLETLERSAAQVPEDNPGAFLQVSGLRFTIADGHAVDVSIEGKPLEPNASYTVVTPDFLAAGGDGYAAIKAMEGQVMTGQLILDMLIDAFRQVGEVTAQTDGRITRR